MPKPELWRVVPSQPDILVSARVGHWDGSTYIFRHNKKTFTLARLVCEAFNGPPTKERNVCMHVDENARNNAPDNLQWGTQKENLNAPGYLKYCQNRTGENSSTAKGLKKRIAA